VHGLEKRAPIEKRRWLASAGLFLYAAVLFAGDPVPTGRRRREGRRELRRGISPEWQAAFAQISEWRSACVIARTRRGRSVPPHLKRSGRPNPRIRSVWRPFRCKLADALSGVVPMSTQVVGDLASTPQAQLAQQFMDM